MSNPYDFDISDELSAGSSEGNDYSFGNRRYDAKPKLYNASASHARASSPTSDDTSDDSYITSNKSRNGGAASKAKSGGSLASKASNNAQSLEERVAARLAGLRNERAAATSSAAGSTVSMPASADVSAISAKSNMSGAFQIESADDTAVSGITAASRARNLGSTAPARSAPASANVSGIGSVGGGSLKSAGRGGRAAAGFGSPLSPGELDDSSSVDLSSGDFQVGAVAAKALAARRAASINDGGNSMSSSVASALGSLYGASVASGAGNMSGGSFGGGGGRNYNGSVPASANVTSATVPEASARSEESDSSNNYSDESAEIRGGYGRTNGSYAGAAGAGRPGVPSAGMSASASFRVGAGEAGGRGSAPPSANNSFTAGSARAGAAGGADESRSTGSYYGDDGDGDGDEHGDNTDESHGDSFDDDHDEASGSAGDHSNANSTADSRQGNAPGAVGVRSASTSVAGGAAAAAGGGDGAARPSLNMCTISGGAGAGTGTGLNSGTGSRAGSATTSPTRAAPASSMTPGGGAGGGSGSAGSNGHKRDSSTMTFAELAMMMREQALLAKQTVEQHKSSALSSAAATPVASTPPAAASASTPTFPATATGTSGIITSAPAAGVPQSSAHASGASTPILNGAASTASTPTAAASAAYGANGFNGLFTTGSSASSVAAGAAARGASTGVLPTVTVIDQGTATALSSAAASGQQSLNASYASTVDGGLPPPPPPQGTPPRYSSAYHQPQPQLGGYPGVMMMPHEQQQQMQMAQFMMSGAGGGSIPALNAATIANNNANLAASLRAAAASALSKQLKSASIAQQQQGRRRKASTAGSSDNGVNDAEGAEDETAEEDTQAPSAILSAYVTDHEITAALGAADATAGYDEAEGADNRGLLGHSARPPRGRSLPPPPPPPGVDGGYGINDDQGSESSGWPRSRSSSLREESARNRDARVSGVVPLQAYHIRTAVAASGFHPLPPRFSSVSSAAVRNGRAHNAHSEASSVSGASEGSNAGSHHRRPSHEVRMTKTQVLRAERAREYITSHPDPPPPPPPPAFDPSYQTSDQLRSAIGRNGSRSGGNQRVASRTTSAQSRYRQPSGVDTAAEDRYDADRRRRRTGEESGIRFRFVSKEGEVSFGDTSRLVDDADVDLEAADGLDRTGEADEADQSAHETGIRGIGAGMSGAASRKATAAAERQRSSSTKKSSTPLELHALAYSIDRTSIMNAGPPFRLQQHQQQPVTSVGMGIGSTRGRPIGSRRNVNGSSTSNNVNESAASVGGTAAKSPNNNGGLRPSPLDASLANALIADATAARYKAESKVNELQVALNQLELKLQKAERNETDIGGTVVSPSSAAASPRGTEARAPTAAPQLTLYPLLREAITQLTVHRPAASAPSDDDAANGADQHQNGYSVRRFIRDHDAVKAGGKGLKRAWSPIGRDPLQAAPPSANVTTADADSSNMNAASGASAGTAVYYDEVPVASAVSAAEGDGYRSYVPLKLVASLQSELASQEKMLNAYHNDNQKLREQLKASNERLAESALPAAASNGAASSPSTQEPRPAADGHQHHQLERTVNDEGAHLAPSAGINTVNVAPAESFLVSEIQRLQSEISLSRQRQEEMSIQIRDLKASNRDLECRAAGVDMAAVKHDSEEVLRLRKELAEFQTKHKDAVADLQKKIDWYRDNQAIIDADAATIAGQASIIRELQDKLAQMRDAAASSSSATGFVSSRAVVQSKPGVGFTSPVKSKPASPASTSPKDTASSPAGGTAPSSPRSAVAAAKSALQSLQQHLNSNSNGSAAAASAPQHHASDPEHALAIANRKIKDLENSLKVAEDTLSKRYPDSIANLIREAKGSTVAHGEPAAVLQELERVKATTEQKDDEHNRRLRSLQQQFEQLRDAHGKKEQQYEGELKTLRSRLAALGDAEAASGALGTIDLSSAEAVSSREKSLRHRILELEKELERVREFYDQKSREFRKSTGAAAGRKATPVSAAATPPAAAPAAAAGTAAPSEAVVAVPAASSSSSSGVPGGSDDEGGIKSKKADVVASSKAKSATASAAGAGAKPPSGKTGKSAVNTSKGSNASSSATSTGTRTASNSRSRSPSVGARAGGDGSRRTSIASTATGISKVGAAKPALPSVPAAPTAAAAKRSTTAAATAKAAASAAGTTAKPSRAAAASAPTARPGAGTPGKDKKPSASKAATSERSPSPSPSTTVRSVSPAGRAASPGPSSSPSAGAGHEPRSLPEVTDLLSQVARLEAENVKLKDSLNSVSSRPGGDGDQPLPQQPDRLKQTLPSIAEGAELQLTPVTDIADAPSWASAARQNQEILLRKIDQLYAAISLLEARAEAREIELARAEHAVSSARSAAEVLLRSQYEDVLRVKDDALRQAKQEVRELVAAVMDMQQQQRNGTGSQVGAGMQTASHPAPMHWQQLQDRQPEHHSQLQPTPRS